MSPALAGWFLTTNTTWEAHAYCSDGKASAYNVGDRVQSLGWEDPLEKEMATHSSTLAWKIPWMKPGSLQSMGSQKVGHD